MTKAPKEIYYDPRDGYISGSVPPEHPAFAHCVAYIRADLSPSPEVVKELVEALRWYGEQARLARLIHSEGDAGRHAIDADGGKRARAVIAKLEGGE